MIVRKMYHFSDKCGRLSYFGVGYRSGTEFSSEIPDGHLRSARSDLAARRAASRKVAPANQCFARRTASGSEHLIDPAAQHLAAVEPACGRWRHAHSRGRPGAGLLPRLVLVWTLRIQLATCPRF